MWDVFRDDIGLDGNVELALVNMDLDDPMLEPVSFDNELREGSSSISLDAEKDLGLGIEEEGEEEDGGDNSENDGYFTIDKMEFY